HPTVTIYTRSSTLHSLFFFYSARHHPELHSFPTRRSSDLANPRRAQNLNTIDEVPDSSWFTNRAGTRALTTEDIFNGPDTSAGPDRKSTRLNSSHLGISYAVFCLKKKKKKRYAIES